MTIRAMKLIPVHQEHSDQIPLKINVSQIGPNRYQTREILFIAH